MAKDQPHDWTDIAKVKNYEENYTVNNLEEGMEYYFAVAAENEAGIGPQAVTEEAVKPMKPKGELICQIHFLFGLVSGVTFFGQVIFYKKSHHVLTAFRRRAALI